MFRSSILALSLLLSPVFIDATTHKVWAGTPPAQNSGVVFVPGNGNQFSLPPVTAVNATTFFGGQSISASLGNNITVSNLGNNPTLTFSQATATSVNTVSAALFPTLPPALQAFLGTTGANVFSLSTNLPPGAVIQVETAVPGGGTTIATPNSFAQAFNLISTANTANAATGATYTINVTFPATATNPGGTISVTLTQSAISGGAATGGNQGQGGGAATGGNQGQEGEGGNQGQGGEGGNQGQGGGNNQ